jgi:murein L,D-transpeptidase YcbB/YkuD
MKKNKFLPYLLFGVPLLVGAYFVIKSLKAKKSESVDDTTPETPKDTKENTNNTTTTTTWVSNDKLPFKKGMKSNYINYIQAKLQIVTDSKFGNETLNAVKLFQKKNGLTTNGVADGIVGAKTWKALFGVDFPSTNTKPIDLSVKDTLIVHDPTKPFVLGGTNW